MIRKLLSILLLLGLISLWLFSDRLFPPEIIRAETATVRDGDTLVLDKVIYRLHGVDAPEYHQICKDGEGRHWPCGKAARLQLAAMVAPGNIACTPQAEDRYNRKVARCASATVPDLSRAMVEAGLAISPAERGTAPYADEEEAARAQKRGLWQGDFDTPADWRASHPRTP
jgi:endonuclease YncB( thermonuclease family)